MLTVVPFTVMAVPAEWANHRRSSGWEQNSSWQRPLPVPVPVPVPELQQAHKASPVLLSGQAQDTFVPSPRPVPTVAPPSRPAVVEKPATPLDAYSAWLVAHPVVRDADLTASGVAEGQVPQRVSVALRAQAVSDFRDAGTPDGISPSRPGLVGLRLHDTVDLTGVEATAIVPERTADVDLSQEGTLPGVPPRQLSVIGERLELVVDLSRAGSFPGVPPHIPTREDP